MNQEQQEQFRKEYKAIVNQQLQIRKTNAYLKTLTYYDKNGSHKNAILKAMDEKDEQKAKLNEMLKGISYEKWKKTSSELSLCLYKINKRLSTQKNWEAKLNDLTFEYGQTSNSN